MAPDIKRNKNRVPTTAFVGGSPKAGTTSMWYYLSQHPNIYGGEEKEVQFFNGNNWDKGIDWYIKRYEKYDGEKHVIDGSHTLITAPDVAFKRIEKFINEPKFIFLVRDPIDRLVSTYKFGFKHGQKPYKYFGSFSEWIRSDGSKRDIEYGKYFKYISRFWRVFGGESVKIVLFSSISSCTKKSVKSVYRYLGVDDQFNPEVEVKNKSGQASGGYQIVSAGQKSLHYLERVTGLRLRNAATSRVKSMLLRMTGKGRLATEEDRRYLTEVYASDAEKLQDAVEYDLSHWSVLR